MEGRGIGTALVVRASEILRDSGADTCHIGWTVRESFYARGGYQGPGAATACSAQPPALTSLRLPLVRQSGVRRTLDSGTGPVNGHRVPALTMARPATRGHTAHPIGLV